MSLYFQPYDFHQPYLMPPSLQDWLPQDHLAFFICDALDQIDLTPMDQKCGLVAKGRPAYNPLMMMRVLVYAYCNGIVSSRRIEKATYEDVPFRMLAANQHPDHDTIADFRATHRENFKKFFTQVLLLCEQAGLVNLGHVSLDGTKMKANASKHKAMSYEYMQKREKELQAEVDKLLAQAQQSDETEDALHGKGRRGDEVPEELQRRQSRLEKIREAKQSLEEIARQGAAEKQQQREELERKAEQEGRVVPGHPPKTDATPDPKAQRNFTDPESSIMKGPDGFVQAFNAQAVADEKSQVIVACEVTNCAADASQMEAMVDQVKENLGRYPQRMSSDAGYFSERNVQVLQERGVDPYIATGRQKHGEQPAGSPRGRIAKGASVKQRMKRKLMTQKGKKIYSRRKAIIEPVFGQIKNRGFRRFSFRGLEKVRQEWAMVCMAHNLLKLYRAKKGMASVN